MLDTTFQVTNRYARYSSKGLSGEFLGWFYLVLGAVVLMAAADEVYAQNTQTRTYTFADESRVWVEGTSTVHDWSCEAQTFTGHVSVSVGADQPARGIQEAQLTVPVEQMECGRSTMNRKMQDAFRVKQNPSISFQAGEIVVGSSTGESEQAIPVTATGKLTMAGRTQTVEIVGDVQRVNGRLHIVGQKNVNMTDYGMDPPTAVFGTIRTNERVTVYFDIWAHHEG